MSGSDDDWENQLDSDNEKEQEKKKEEEKKAQQAKFADEDAVDPEEVKKRKAEELKKQQEEQLANARVKSTNKVDYDKIYAERQAKLGNPQPETKKEADAKGNMSKAAKGIALERAAEEGLANQLFGDEEGQKVKLSSEKDYINFAKKVSEHLYDGNAPYHIEKFFKELAKEMPKHCESKHIKSTSDNFMTHYNTKLKEEKSKTGKKKAPTLKGGGGKGYDRNNNPAMINDVIGNAGDEYGEYGEETGFKREEEGDFDFM